MRRLREIKKYAAIGIAIYCILKNASDRKMEIEALRNEVDFMKNKLEKAKHDCNCSFMNHYNVWIILKDVWANNTLDLDSLSDKDRKILEEFIKNGPYVVGD